MCLKGGMGSGLVIVWKMYTTGGQNVLRGIEIVVVGCFWGRRWMYLCTGGLWREGMAVAGGLRRVFGIDIHIVN